MYGRSFVQDKGQIAPAAPYNAQANGAMRPGSRGGWVAAVPITLVIALALYFVWALLEQHQRVRAAIKPSAIGLNIRNIAVIMVTVILGLNLAKIVSAKAVAWKLPGARLVAQLVGGA